MRIAVVGYRLAGRRSGAAVSALELGVLLAERGHAVEFASLHGGVCTPHGRRVRLGEAAVKRAVAAADRVVVRDEQELSALLGLLGRARPVMVVHSPAGSPQALGIAPERLRAAIWVAGHVLTTVQAARGPWGGRDEVIEGLPIVPDWYRTQRGARATLVNLSEKKGGPLFYRIAAEAPGIAFLGVRGWGKQETAAVPPNVLVRPFALDPREVYRETRVLLVLSSDGTPGAGLDGWAEAWCRVPIEAGISGIPTIAHPSAGVRASAGDAAQYVYREKTAAWAALLASLEDPETYRAASERARDHAESVAARRGEILDRYEEVICG